MPRKIDALQYRQDAFPIANYHNRKTSLPTGLHVVQKITIIRVRRKSENSLQFVSNLILCTGAIWQRRKLEYGCTTTNHRV